MKLRKSKKKDQEFFDLLLKQSKKVRIPERTGSLLEQIVDVILSEDEKKATLAEETRDKLTTQFVDWNEIRIVMPDRLQPFFSVHKNGDYKLKAVQAVLNKIFSRSGSLAHQFLLDLEIEALEDYLAGIMELSESTRKNIILEAFSLPILPVTLDHEIIFERVGTSYAIGDETSKKIFAELSPEELLGVKQTLDSVLSKHCKEKPLCAKCPLKSVCIEASSS